MEIFTADDNPESARGKSLEDALREDDLVTVFEKALHLPNYHKFVVDELYKRVGDSEILRVMQEINTKWNALEES